METIQTWTKRAFNKVNVLIVSVSLIRRERDFDVIIY